MWKKGSMETLGSVWLDLSQGETRILIMRASKQKLDCWNKTMCHFETKFWGKRTRWLLIFYRRNSLDEFKFNSQINNS